MNKTMCISKDWPELMYFYHDGEREYTICCWRVIVIDLLKNILKGRTQNNER